MYAVSLEVLRKLMQDLQKIPFLFLLEMNLNSNSDCQYQECKGGQQCETQQAVIQACFLSLSHSHIASSIKNSVPTKRQSYHTFPPPLRC